VSRDREVGGGRRSKKEGKERGGATGKKRQV
jgi:hypothetical protein